MSATELPDDVLDVTLSMVDVRTWSTKFRMLSLLRVLQRRSPHGWAIIGYREVARRIDADERYVQKLLHELWRNDRVLIRGPVGVGTRGTAWRVNPDPDEWRNVPWREQRREIRALRAQSASREPDRGANPGLATETQSAALTPAAPRSLVAALDHLAPRSRSRHSDVVGAAPMDRGASGRNRPPSLSSWSDADASSLEREFVAALTGAIKAKTHRECNDTLTRELAQLYGKLPTEVMVRCVMAAPEDYKPPMIIRVWLPDRIRDGGALPEPERPVTAARVLGEPPDCATCHGRRWILPDDSDDSIPCPACCRTPVAE